MLLGRFPATHAETSTAPFHVVWRVYPFLDLTQVSGILSGIAAVVRSGAVSLSVEFVCGTGETIRPLLELIVTERKTGRVRKIALDFYDRADRIVPDALSFSDVYFKRQFGPETQMAAGRSAEKVAPLGLTVAGYSSGALRHVCAAILASL